MAAYTGIVGGPPTRGQFQLGDTFTDSNGVVYECIRAGAAGIPGMGDTGGAIFVATGGFRTGATSLSKQAAPAAKTTTTTLTAAELIGGLITGNQGAAGAASYTLPLASALETALLAIYPGLAADDSFDFHVINLSTVAAEDITLLTAAGWTLSGSMVIESNEATAQKGPSAHFRVRRTAANAYTLYRVA